MLMHVDQARRYRPALAIDNGCAISLDAGSDLSDLVVFNEDIDTFPYGIAGTVPDTHVGDEHLNRFFFPGGTG
jgi:hypothetical protein